MWGCSHYFRLTTPPETFCKRYPAYQNITKGYLKLEKKSPTYRPHLLFVNQHTDSSISLCCCKEKFRGKDKQWMLTGDCRPQRIWTPYLQNNVPAKAVWKQELCLASYFKHIKQTTGGKGKTKKKRWHTQIWLGMLLINNSFFLTLPSWFWFGGGFLFCFLTWG